jgi:tryptophanase
MSPKEISEVLFKIFSDEGFSVNGFKIKSESPLIANVYNEDETTTISFGTNYPRAEVTRLITLYAYIEQLVFRKDGGTVRLKNFPDISFGYDKSNILNFLDHLTYAGECEIEKEIEKKYSDDTRRKIAKDCLQYATEWATIVSQSDGFSGAGPAKRKELKRQCYDFVVENVRKEANEKKYGSVILTYLLVFIIIPAVARFIIVRLLEKYF